MSRQDDIFKDVLLAAIKEQRARRRWGIFFKSLFFIILLAFLSTFWSLGDTENKFFKKKYTQSYAAVIYLKNIISSDSVTNADNMRDSLKEAFSDPRVKGVLLDINSPGGSAVQASDIYQAIRYQRRLHPAIKIYAVCSDICTSAAYYAACGTDGIYANPASLVGSIGVLIDGFGFVDSLRKLGIERRLLTSGLHKGFLDPFSKLQASDRQRAEQMLSQIHDQFKQVVIKSRGERLKITEETFSGLPWTGEEALKQGLIDGYGNVEEVADKFFHTRHLEDFTVKPAPWDAFAQKVGASLAVSFQTFLSALRVR